VKVGDKSGGGGDGLFAVMALNGAGFGKHGRGTAWAGSPCHGRSRRLFINYPVAEVSVPLRVIVAHLFTTVG